jgi:hypothetical protein
MNMNQVRVVQGIVFPPYCAMRDVYLSPAVTRVLIIQLLSPITLAYRPVCTMIETACRERIYGAGV